MSRVSIHIVAWNSMRFLPEALESIYAQTRLTGRQAERDFSVIVVDNASDDGVVDYLRAHWPQVVTLRNRRNLGFPRAHNQAIELARSMWARQEGETADRFVLVTNPDIVLTPDYLTRMLAAAEAHPRAGSFGGKLLKVWEKRDGELREGVRSDMIDTTGLRVFRTMRVAERGAGEKDAGQYRAGEVFGFSAALALYRLRALEAVRQGDEYFDERFFAYKEDVDLAWRLRRAGWKAWYVPDAVAYHYRGAYGSERRSLWKAWKERRAKSRLVNRLSTRNHLWLLAKNLDAKTFLVYGPLILGYEALKFLYALVFEWSSLGGYLEALAGLPGMMKKRRHAIMRPEGVQG